MMAKSVPLGPHGGQGESGPYNTSRLQPSHDNSAQSTVLAQGPTGPLTPTDTTPATGRTRGFGWTYETSPTVRTPVGPMNPGYVHNVVSTNGQWSRGELPALGYGYGFALARPRFMREPRTDVGTYNFAQG